MPGPRKVSEAEKVATRRQLREQLEQDLRDNKKTHPVLKIVRGKK